MGCTLGSSAIGTIPVSIRSQQSEDAFVYSEVKKAILRRYDINEETYRQCFRAARRKEGEPYIELATRMATSLASGLPIVQPWRPF